MDQLTPFPRRSSRPSGGPELHLAPTWSGEPGLRVGDAERATACDALAEHFAAGRLDPAELDDRLARAMAARSADDLRAVFRDLEPRRRVAAPVPVPAEPEASGALVVVLASFLVMSLLVAGAMLLALGAYNTALFLAALLGGTATAVAGGCAVAIAQRTLRRR